MAKRSTQVVVRSTQPELIWYRYRKNGLVHVAMDFIVEKWTYDNLSHNENDKPIRWQLLISFLFTKLWTNPQTHNNDAGSEWKSMQQINRLNSKGLQNQLPTKLEFDGSRELWNRLSCEWWRRQVCNIPTCKKTLQDVLLYKRLRTSLQLLPTEMSAKN